MTDDDVLEVQCRLVGICAELTALRDSLGPEADTLHADGSEGGQTHARITSALAALQGLPVLSGWVITYRGDIDPADPFGTATILGMNGRNLPGACTGNEFVKEEEINIVWPWSEPD